MGIYRISGFMVTEDFTKLLSESLGFIVESSDINEKDVKFIIKELLQYLLPDLPVDYFEKAIFPDRLGNLEARLTFKFRKTDKKFWVDISKGTSSRNYIGSLIVTTDKSKDELFISVVAIRGNFEGLQRKNVKLHFTLTSDQLKHPIPTKKLFDNISELKDIRDMFKELFDKVKELGGKV